MLSLEKTVQLDAVFGGIAARRGVARDVEESLRRVSRRELRPLVKSDLLFELIGRVGERSLVGPRRPPLFLFARQWRVTW